MARLEKILPIVLLIALPLLCPASTNQLTVTAVNKLGIARLSQTIELSAQQLSPLGEKDFNKIHVLDSAGKEVLCQAVDTDGDDYRKPDVLIFQSDFAPDEIKIFSVITGRKREYKKADFKAYGRFVRERFDDFTWENDRIAHRTYGKALETWKGEPLTSSAIDIWSKRVPYPVIDAWYMADNYHADTGEGFDDYSCGKSRGDGGNGLWAADRLWVSKNFISSRVLANGPIRVMFELTYDPFDVNGIRVSDVKRITLDAGQNLDHYQSFYKPEASAGQSLALTTGIGLKKVAGEQMELNAKQGWLVKWEPMEKNAGDQGLAIVFDAKLFEKQTEDNLNQLVIAKVPADNAASYWAGFCWDKAGQFQDSASWKKYVDDFAQGLASPIAVNVKEK
ncbi:MAG: DUF4861 family protein [Limisphaerales bacterium]